MSGYFFFLSSSSSSILSWSPSSICLTLCRDCNKIERHSKTKIIVCLVCAICMLFIRGKLGVYRGFIICYLSDRTWKSLISFLASSYCTGGTYRSRRWSVLVLNLSSFNFLLYSSKISTAFLGWSASSFAKSSVRWSYLERIVESKLIICLLRILFVVNILFSSLLFQVFIIKKYIYFRINMEQLMLLSCSHIIGSLLRNAVVTVNIIWNIVRILEIKGYITQEEYNCIILIVGNSAARLQAVTRFCAVFLKKFLRASNVVLHAGNVVRRCLFYSIRILHSYYVIFHVSLHATNSQNWMRRHISSDTRYNIIAVT